MKEVAIVYLILGLIATTHTAPLYAQEDTPLSPLSRIMAAEMALNRNLPDLALAFYVQSLELKPHPLLAEQATQLAIELHHEDIALYAAKQWAILAPQHLDAQLIAIVLYSNKTVDQVLPFLIQAHQLDPQAFHTHISDIQSNLAAQSQKTLQKACLRIAMKHPKDPYAALTFAESAALNLDVKTAEKWVNQALILAPYLTQAIELKARIIRYQNTDDRAALAYLNSTLRENPQNKALTFFYAQALLDAQELEPAMTLLKQLLHDPEYQDRALLLVGQSLEQRNQHKEAIQTYRKIAPGPEHTTAMIRLSALYMLQKDSHQAIDVLHHAQPTSFQEYKTILLSEMDILLDIQAWEAAITLGEQALETLPQDLDFLDRLERASQSLKATHKIP